MYKKFIQTTLVFGLMFISFSDKLFADDCMQACEKFVTCSEEMNKRKATAGEKATLEKACSQTCAKKTDKVMECYNASKSASGSCTTYGQCIYKYAQAGKKK